MVDISEVNKIIMTTIMNLELYSSYVFTMNEMTLKIHLTTNLISLEP